jgi:hypothetical protein
MADHDVVVADPVQFDGQAAGDTHVLDVFGGFEGDGCG